MPDTPESKIPPRPEIPLKSAVVEKTTLAGAATHLATEGLKETAVLAGAAAVATVKMAVGQTISTTTPTLAVAGMASLGAYTFQLTVVDKHGFVSQPALLRVLVNKVG
jgi:hypothetical protein